MTGLEIAILIIGILLVTGSFFMTKKLSESDVLELQKMSKAEIKTILDKELTESDKKIKDKLGNAVKEVKVTNRLTDSPSCVTKDAGDAQMAQMMQMMRAMGQTMPESAPILEINPEHEIVKKLNGCADDSTIEDVAWILLDQAKLSEGMEITDTVAFAKRLSRITAKAL